MKSDIDQILRDVLTSTEEPDRKLNEKIINQIKEAEYMRKFNKRRIPTTALVVVLMLVISSISVYAAWRCLSPSQVAEVVEDKKLTDAFLSDDAITINESQIYEDYKITLLGVVSGENLSDYVSTHNDIVQNNRTYVVVAIEHVDGTPMPDTRDPEYDKISFFVSPLIKGRNPVEFNIITMHGGYTQIVEDGIMYRIAECNNVEVFADHGLYICVSDTIFYEPSAYIYDEETGVISRNEAYEGVNALFELPLDINKANPDAAKEYINQLKDSQKKGFDLGEDIIEGEEWNAEKVQKEAILIEDSVQILTPDENGMVHYSFDYSGMSGEGSINVSAIFHDGQVGMSDYIGIISTDDGNEVLQTFTMNKDGTVTYALYKKQ